MFYIDTCWTFGVHQTFLYEYTKVQSVLTLAANQNNQGYFKKYPAWVPILGCN